MVPVKLDGFKAGGLCAGFAGVIGDEVPSRRHSCTVLFIFFGADSANDSCVRHSSVGRHLVFVDEEDGVGSFDIARLDALC